MENLSVSALITLAATLLGIAGGYFGLKHSMKSEAAAEGKSEGVMLNEIAHIQSGIEEIKKEQARISGMIIGFVQDLAVLKSQVEAEHRRLDAIEKTMRELERRSPQ
jgi:archaellum component FlaC